ncbi:Cas10/Cmr2 second palm domain-containing protein [Nocardiopsis sp. LOL_012]|uniref:Cas10/Cmr2 second palm domain-containing protein n=1 Tax=Nocardiopsis sp. LOL_012 TaxID=3345409 RepID=UPI003A868DE7
MSGNDPRDLVVIALSGVQRYITESRTTADLRSGSQIVAHLADKAVSRLVSAHGATIVFPAPTGEGTDGVGDGMPNRVVALLEPGTGRTAASDTKDRLDAVWEKWVYDVFGRHMHATPGWPTVQWVSVPADPSASYADQWDRAQRSLAQRKNTRNFEQPDDTPGELCMLSPRWRSAEVPAKALEHMKDERLAVANWAKRLWQHTEPGSRVTFSSTNAIASSPYRRAVLERWNTVPEISALVSRLHRAALALGKDPITEPPTAGLPEEPEGGDPRWLRGRGSRWVFPESWHLDVLAREFTDSPEASEARRGEPKFASAVRDGREAADALARTMSEHGVRPPSPHLAVLVQDLDSMGRYLSDMDLSQGHTVHTEVSGRLARTARDQREAVERVGGFVVYAGGDDLLALVPAARALEAARTARSAIAPGLPHASNGILFFHHGSSLRRALAQAHELLEKAKERDGKNSLGVGFIRGSGSHAECVLPWQERRDGAPASEGSPVDALDLFASYDSHPRARLSPRLLPDLLTEQVHLDGGGEQDQGGYEALDREVARAEMRRLVQRHTSLTTATGEEVSEDDSIPKKKDSAERRAFAVEAARALERMAPGKRLVDEGAVRVALFLRQEAQ